MRGRFFVSLVGGLVIATGLVIAARSVRAQCSDPDYICAYSDDATGIWTFTCEDTTANTASFYQTGPPRNEAPLESADLDPDPASAPVLFF